MTGCKTLTLVLFSLLAGCAEEPYPERACEVAGWCGYACGEMAADAFNGAGVFGQAEAQACRAECIEDVEVSGASSSQAEELVDGVGVECNHAGAMGAPGGCEAAIGRCVGG